MSTNKVYGDNPNKLDFIEKKKSFNLLIIFLSFYIKELIFLVIFDFKIDGKSSIISLTNPIVSIFFASF
jgi:hypothetical protein